MNPVRMHNAKSVRKDAGIQKTLPVIAVKGGGMQHGF